MSKGFACLLHPQAPKELHNALDGYLHIHEPSKQLFFVASGMHDGSYFIQFDIVKDKNSKPWKFSISPQHILGIAEIGEGTPVGFF